jgi:catechol 2,3-dioxygenase-like lactoylglutathione lyase family enzyme
MSTQDDRARSLGPERGIVKPRQLAHVVRRTSRFEELVQWYCTVLGAEVVHEDGMLAFLTYDDEHHRIAIARIPGLEDQPAMAAGTDHIAFTFADLGDLLHTYVRLEAAGIAPFWCINHGPTTSMYYKDPDGNRVEHAGRQHAVERGDRRVDAERRLRREPDRGGLRSGRAARALPCRRAALHAHGSPAAPRGSEPVRHAPVLTRAVRSAPPAAGEP